MIQFNNNKIPRWLVENDPSWEKSIDSNLGMLKWTKRGTNIQAVCSPTSMFCEIVGQNEPLQKQEQQPSPLDLSDVISSMSRIGSHASLAGIGDITKYLSSRYLNPEINAPRFDLKKIRQLP